MNLSDAVGPARTLAFRVWRAIIVLVPVGRVRAFGDGVDQIGAIVVVNLDRQPKRWRLVAKELRRFRASNGSPLTSMVQRFSAIDARDGRAAAANGDVDPMYSIGDQLYVQPDARLALSFGLDEPVRMSRQEVAVARSHVEIWKVVATGINDYVLVLEDDVWFKPGAAAAIDRGWREALARFNEVGGPNLVYLSYEDAGGTALRVNETVHVFQPLRGLWFLSGYVLSRAGAAALLRAMPVVGPVDLWMNYRFAELKVLALTSPAIAQRHDAASDNSYSVLPYLARAGVVDARHGLKPPDASRSSQVLAWTSGAERESLSMALSMLGLRVRVFDGQEEPLDQHQLLALLQTFDALVDAPLAPVAVAYAMASERTVILLEEEARTPVDLAIDSLPSSRSAVLKGGDPNHESWDEICALLGLARPAEVFPSGALPESRLFRDGRAPSGELYVGAGRRERWLIDDSPWVLPSTLRWRPAQIKNPQTPDGARPIVEASMTEASSALPAITETFPGNLASFAPENLIHGNDGVRIQIGVSDGVLRPFRSGAFASVSTFKYGHFQAEIRAAAGPGLITGFFLHRSSPRQEIDIEFAGNNPRRMLTNVFFNPGDEGATMDYGYRGSPCWIDLGFDSTEDVHRYAIDWWPDRVAWSVDGEVVHERASWDPTPVPHLGMRLHGNLWAPRSHELAGRLDTSNLPASAVFRNVLVTE